MSIHLPSHRNDGMVLSWAKRHGPRHWYRHGRTLCGIPCLGSNYLSETRPTTRDTCPQCESVRTERGLRVA